MIMLLSWFAEVIESRLPPRDSNPDMLIQRQLTVAARTPGMCLANTGVKTLETLLSNCLSVTLLGPIAA